MKPMMSDPATGTRTTSQPSVLPAGDTSATSHRWKKARFVTRPISRSSARATQALRNPIPTAAADIGRSCQVVVKSPRWSEPSCSSRLSTPVIFCQSPLLMTLTPRSASRSRPRPARPASPDRGCPRGGGGRDEGVERPAERRRHRAQLRAMGVRQPREYRLGAPCEVHEHPPPVGPGPRPADQAPRLHAVDELDGGVVLDLQPLGEEPDGGVYPRGHALHREQELVLLRLETGRSGRAFAEALEPA